MNDDGEISAISLGMYSILLSNKWEMTVELFDGTIITGKLKGQKVQRKPFEIKITVITLNDGEVIIDLKNVKDITA